MSKEEHESVMTDIYVWMHRHFPHFLDCRPIDVSQRLREARFKVERIERMSIWGLPVAIALARKTDIIANSVTPQTGSDTSVCC